MHRFKFEEDDLFINRLKTYPEYNLFIYQSVVYINNARHSTAPGTIQDNGGLYVYEINQNRPGSNVDRVRPQMSASALRDVFKNQVYNPLVKSNSANRYFTRKNFATLDNPNILSAYPISVPTNLQSVYGPVSQISRTLTEPTRQPMNYWDLQLNQTRSLTSHRTINVTASALYNSAKKYTILSEHFDLSGSLLRPLAQRDLIRGTNPINMLFIPSMYYGSTIKKGSVKLQYFITGSKIAECSDLRENGLLIGTTGSTSGSVVGLVLYDEGVIMLTSSTNLETGPTGTPGVDNAALGIQYLHPDSTTPISSSWIRFGSTLGLNTPPASTKLSGSSYALDFKGTTYINSMTMFAHAKRGHLNHSNNPTYRDLSDSRMSQTSAGIVYAEGDSKIKNIVSASYSSASFEKTTYISKVNIYDENENLIGVASLANPVKKTLDREYLFKLKLDI